MNALKNPAGESLDHHFHPGNMRNNLVILVHGLTGNKDRPLLVALAEGLTKHGWPCLRLSFSGNGESGGRFTASCITKQVGDLKAVLDTVPDHVRIACIGHSMGAATAILTALGDLRIRTLVSLAGMIKPADFAAREFAGLTPDQDCIWEDESFPLSAALVDDMKRIDSLLPMLEKLVQPLLLIHGTEDDVVPLDESREASRVARNGCELLEVPSADHVFGDDSHPLLIATIDRWLAAHCGRE